MGNTVLTVPEMAILLGLGEDANTHLGLAPRVRLSPSALPEHLDRLERRGLVHHDKTGEWKLTPRGLKLRNGIVHRTGSTSDPGVFVVEESLGESLSADDLDAALDRAITSSEK